MTTMNEDNFSLSILAYLPQSAREQLTKERLAAMTIMGEQAEQVATLEATVAALREALVAVCGAADGLKERVEGLANFYLDLEDAPDGAVPAWDLVALKLNELRYEIEKARELTTPTVTTQPPKATP